MAESKEKCNQFTDWAHKQKMAAIRKQIEFYFSDSNYRKDAFLKAAAEADAEKFVPIATLLTFNKLKALTTDAKEVAEAVKDSDLLEVSADGLKIKRSSDLPEVDSSNERTVYVKGFPVGDSSVTIESVGEQFSVYGKVCMVRLRREKGTQNFRGSVFIEFDTEAAAKKVVEVANEGDEIKLAYKGVPFLCVMPFVEWYKRKQAKWESRKEGKDAAPVGAKRNRDDSAVKFTPGLIFHVAGLPSDTNMLHLKGFLKTLAEVKFVEYTAGETSATVRLADAANAEKLLAAFTAGVVYQVEAGDEQAASKNNLSGNVITGEEETAYWTKIEAASKGRNGGKGGRGGGRGGRGGRGFKKGRRN